MAKHSAANRSTARRRPRSGRSIAAVAATTTICGLLSPPPGPSTSDAFTPPSTHHRPHRCRRAPPSSPAVGVFAPPGSGYVRSDEATDEDAAESHPELTAADISAISPRAFPDTYEPMLEYPGTMRPGRTPENMPYHDLPGMNPEDNDPVPWPHFQEIEWHHKWEPPHPQAPAMEEFIETEGRWATAEDEAEMRMTARRGVRERREAEEAGGDTTGTVLLDDDEDEGDATAVGLGEGVKALLETASAGGDEDDEEEEEEDGDDLLSALGLGDDDDDDDEDVDDEEDTDLDFELGFGMDDDDDDEEGLEEDDDDDFEGDADLDDYTKNEDIGADDDFDDGGFDYD